MRLNPSLLAFAALIVIAALIVGCTGTPGINSTPGSGGVTPTVVQSSPTWTPQTGTLTPETVVPLAVPGFDFLDKTDPEDGIYDGEEYFVSSYFVPSAGSKYENKTDLLEVDVGLFTNATAASAEIADYGTDLSVAGIPGKYWYDPEYAVSSVAVQRGSLFIESLAQGVENMSPTDEPILQDAAIQGATAALKNIP